MPADSLATIDLGTANTVFNTLLPQWGFVIVILGVWLLNKLKTFDSFPTPVVIWLLCQAAAFTVKALFAPELGVLEATTAGSALAGNTWFVARIMNLGKNKKNGG